MIHTKPLSDCSAKELILKLCEISVLPETIDTLNKTGELKNQLALTLEKESGMYDLKQTQLNLRRESKGEKGKQWMALSAKLINNVEAKAMETEYSFAYWVNYGDGNTYGWFTVELIKQWLTTADLKLHTLGGKKER